MSVVGTAASFDHGTSNQVPQTGNVHSFSIKINTCHRYDRVVMFDIWCDTCYAAQLHLSILCLETI